MMIHCLNSSGSVAVAGGNTGVEMTVLERQRARMKWQQQMQQQQLQQGFDQYGLCSVLDQGSAGVAVSQFQANTQMCRDAAGLQHMVKPDPGLDGGWAGFGSYAMPGVGDGVMSCGYVNDVRTDEHASYQMMKTVSCPVPVLGDVSEGKDSILTEKMSLGAASAGGGGAKEDSKKRKAEKAASSFKAAAESDTKPKKIKEWAEDGESKITQPNRSNNSKNKNKEEASADTSKDNSKVSEVKTDYIHVRARRGQATDSHSLAERVRREKISERMKYLQDLVPGCNKITGKAGMLDEIINYVQSLQRQVEFLSMKLATVNPRPVSFSIDNLFGKEVFAPSLSSYPTLRELSQMANSAYTQFSHLEEVVSPGLDLGSYQPDMGLQRPAPETFIDTPSFIQMQPNPSTWDADLQNLLTMDFQGRSASFPLQPFTGSNEASNLKMEI